MFGLDLSVDETDVPVMDTWHLIWLFWVAQVFREGFQAKGGRIENVDDKYFAWLLPLVIKQRLLNIQW